MIVMLAVPVQLDVDAFVAVSGLGPLDFQDLRAVHFGDDNVAGFRSVAGAFVAVVHNFDLVAVSVDLADDLAFGEGFKIAFPKNLFKGESASGGKHYRRE